MTIKNKNGIFSSLTPIKRALLFYLICIWVRLYIAFFIYKNWNNKIWLYVVIFASIVSIYLNWTKLDGKVWWNRYIHCLNAILLLIFALLVINGYINGKILGVILFWDVLFGILYSFYKHPFSN